MHILSIHNRYLMRGGEEESYELEAAILQENGHQVDTYEENNLNLKTLSSAHLALRTIWSVESYRQVTEKLTSSQYDIVHVHNFFPLISPSVYYAARKAKVPVVQTLQNFRLLCPNALFLREGKVCEACLDKFIPYPGVVHGCYRNSKVSSAGVAAMLSVHRALGTWKNLVDRYIALTNYDRDKFIQGSIPGDKITVKPNIIHPDPGVGEGKGNYAVFVGRLSVEKGIDTLLDAWEKLAPKIPLKIVGEGPLADLVAETARRIPQIEWLGYKPLEQVFDVVGQAQFFIYPSKWNETFSRVAVEAFAKGTPVIAAAGVTAMKELVDPGRTGLHFKIGDSEDLVTKVKWLLDNPQQLEMMRHQARAEFENRFAAHKNYRQLINIYQLAISQKQQYALENKTNSKVVP
ncbi:putative glycosyl transferase [Hyella patelloides LEGE 07179]|uniref:Putative glycosyl transferase n=1 Tax=Hyella patelloides LEGE 07179 TaxID=945734 RepID=A0A563VN38_9CYAN|nr:glycosyltransferase family 4 protein [Hyella patelloides]VEP12695.1 putative glycosyl transferase [Hyella patelloides LEGE 07179]